MRVVDVHAHYGEWFFPIEASKEEHILQLMQRYDMEKAVFSSSLAIVYDMEEGNKRLAEFLPKSERFYGYVVINPNYPDTSARQLETYLGRTKFLGVKIHPDHTRRPVSCPENIELLERVRKQKKVALLHTWGPEQVEATSRVADTFPDITIIMGHMGGDGIEGAGWRSGIAAARRRPNIYLEVCGSCLHRDRIKEAVRALGDDRVLYGSDMTLLNPSITIGMIEEADISEQSRSKILHDNAVRILAL